MLMIDTHSAGPEQNSAILPAEVTLSVTESPITGDLIAYNGSTINIKFSQFSSWAGAARWGYGTAYVDVSLDQSSNWTLTGDSKVNVLRDSNTHLTNIFSQGHSISYNSSAKGNSWLDHRTIRLSGGGLLKPMSNAATHYH
jgi:hypothetical protein